MTHARDRLCACVTAAWLVAASTTALIGCGDDANEPPKVVQGDDDAGQDDAGSVGPRGADAGDNSIVAGDTHLCSYDDDDRLTVANQLRGDVLASAANELGAGLVFQRVDGALFAAAVPASGALPSPSAVTTADDEASAPRLAASATRFLLGYVRERDAERALVVRDLMDPAAAALVLSRTLAPSSAHGEPWAVAEGADGFVTAFLDDQGAHLQALTTNAAPSGSSKPLELGPMHDPLALALGRFASGGLLVAFPETSAAGETHLFGQRVSETLEPSGSPLQLSKNAIAQGIFGLAARRDSAGLLYPALDGGVRAALKLRRIDESGQPEGPVLNVANAPRIVDSGSIAAFGRGYALVYRELPSLGREQATLRIAFVNPFGSVVYDAELAKLDPTAEAGASSVAAADGPGLVVSWTEPGADGATLHALRLRCPGALVLCGGTVD